MKRFPRGRIHNTKPSKTKEEQANAEGWVYVNASKAIGWNQVWVQEARVLAPEDVEETTQRLYIAAPTACGPQG